MLPVCMSSIDFGALCIGWREALSDGPLACMCYVIMSAAGMFLPVCSTFLFNSDLVKRLEDILWIDIKNASRRHSSPK